MIEELLHLGPFKTSLGSVLIPDFAIGQASALSMQARERMVR